jgi:hypothetical protein
MKQSFFICLLFLTAKICIGQPVTVSHFTRLADLRSASSIADFVRTLGYYNPNDGGGADYIWDANATLKDDSGSVIKPNSIKSGDKGRYILATSDQVNVTQFGAKANDNIDDYDAIMRALKAAKTNSLPVIFPAGTFNIKKQIIIDFPIEMRGKRSQTILYVHYPSKGLKFTFGSSYHTLANITLFSEALYVPEDVLDETQNGIEVEGVAFWDNVIVKQFGGSGATFFGQVYHNPDGSVKSHTNVDFSRITNCYFYANRVHGVSIRGADANGMSFDNTEFVANGGSGVYDNGFLGNHYKGGGTHANSSPEIQWQRSLCKYKGAIWSAKKTGRLSAPGTKEDEWYEMKPYWTGYTAFLSLTNPNVKEYSNKRIYHPGGGYNIGSESGVSAVQIATLFGVYAEADQPPSYVQQNSIVISSNVSLRTGSYISGSGSGVTSRRLQVTDTSNNFSTITPDWFVVGGKVNSLEGVIVRYNRSKKVLEFTDLETQGGGFKFSTPAVGTQFTNPQSFGRRSNDLAGNIISPKLYASTSGTNQYNSLGFATAPPTTGNPTTGDILFNTDVKSQIIGWQCTESDGSNKGGKWRSFVNAR